MNQTSTETKSTKQESYEKVTKAMKSACNKAIVANLLKAPMTRSQLAKATNLKLSTVCGRVAELIKLGVLTEDGKVYDEETDRNVNLVKIVDSLRRKKE